MQAVDPTSQASGPPHTSLLRFFVVKRMALLQQLLFSGIEDPLVQEAWELIAELVCTYGEGHAEAAIQNFHLLSCYTRQNAKHLDLVKTTFKSLTTVKCVLASFADGMNAMMSAIACSIQQDLDAATDDEEWPLSDQCVNAHVACALPSSRTLCTALLQTSFACMMASVSDNAISPPVLSRFCTNNTWTVCGSGCKLRLWIKCRDQQLPRLLLQHRLGHQCKGIRIFSIRDCLFA